MGKISALLTCLLILSFGCGDINTQEEGFTDIGQSPAKWQADAPDDLGDANTPQPDTDNPQIEEAAAIPMIGTCSSASIPTEQPTSVNHETNPYPMPPAGYHAVIAWAQAIVANKTSGAKGSVTVQSLQIWERVGSSKKLIASKITCPACDSNNQVWGYIVLRSQWRNPSAWSGPNTGSNFAISPEGYVIAPVSKKPLYIYHFWNALWPRPAAQQGARYYVVAKAKIEGNAMLQMGLDFWGSTNGGTNIQGATSKWVCASSLWQDVYAGAYK